MPLITAKWTAPDKTGAQTAEYAGHRLRVYPADAPPDAVAKFLELRGETRPGFRWEISYADSGNQDSGWIDTRAAARTEALGRAALRGNPDVPTLDNRPVKSPPSAPAAKVV